MRNPPWTRDELILALDLYVRRGRKQLDATDPEVVALSGLLNRLPFHGAVTRAEGFRNANGVAMKLGNFTAIDPDYRGAGLRRGGQLERDVWSEFAAEPQQLARTASAIRDCIESADARTSLTADATLRDEDDEFQEGRVLARLHFARERNRSVVQRKKESVLARTGRLCCEACGFDFAERYHELGRGFAECHHIVPLADLPSQRGTRLDDLIIVCSNCHRMLHRTRPTPSLAYLRGILARNGHDPVR